MSCIYLYAISCHSDTQIQFTSSLFVNQFRNYCPFQSFSHSFSKTKHHNSIVYIRRIIDSDEVYCLDVTSTHEYILTTTYWPIGCQFYYSSALIKCRYVFCVCLYIDILRIANRPVKLLFISHESQDNAIYWPLNFDNRTWKRLKTFRSIVAHTSRKYIDEGSEKL